MFHTKRTRREVLLPPHKYTPDLLKTEHLARANARHVKAEKRQRYHEKQLAKAERSGIMRANPEKALVNELHFVGTINTDIYRCISENIVTDDVIITNERIIHIKEKHPNDYELYYGFLKESVENPDYILEANKPNSALILKAFEKNDKQFKMILRLVTVEDNPDYKNSIITFMKINNAEWNRLLRNKKMLYKAE